jgi:hypothetical protein
MNNETERNIIISLVNKYHLDRRKKYLIHNGLLCIKEKITEDCQGCTDYGEYGVKYGPFGCEECGYTGKRVCRRFAPASIDGVYIRIKQNPELIGEVNNG